MPKRKIQHKILPYPSLAYFVKIFILSFLYYATADIGLQLGAVSGFATLVWLPTGISLAAVLLFGYRIFPGIFLGAFFANSFHGASLFAALGIATGNTLEALLGAYLLKRFVDFHPQLDRVKDVVGLIIFAAFLSTIVSASIGVSSLYFGNLLSSSILSTFIVWWVGNMISNLIAAPLLLTWSKVPRIHVDMKRAIELIFLIASFVVICFFVFGQEIKTSPLTYIAFPPLIWAALRFGQREVVTAIFALSLIAVWGTARGYGPFSGRELHESLLHLQSFMVIVSITFMILSAAITEKRAFERRKDDFISFASHELKTPITSLKVYTQVLERTFAKKKDKSSLSKIHKVNMQIERLISLINNMLDVSKIQRATLELHEELFSLQELIEDIVDTTESSTRRVIMVQGKLTEDILGDRERLGQVMTNLLSNAVKYSPHNKKIIVTLKTVGNKITVSIKDYGKGIAKEHQDKIFDRFYRVSDEKSSTESGLGIGLYLSKMIIKRHNGDMWVKSIPGRGSTFSFSLPRT